MPRFLIPKTFTIRPDQEDFLKALGPGGEVSRWIRDAIDLRMNGSFASKNPTNPKGNARRTRARKK